VTRPYESLCISEISSSSSLERMCLLLPSRERLFFFLQENGPSPLRGFISALPPLLLQPLHYRLRPLLRCLLFISSLMRRLVLPSRLVNLLPFVVLVLPCCVFCIVLCFCVLLGVLFCGSLSVPCLFCKKATDQKLIPFFFSLIQ